MEGQRDGDSVVVRKMERLFVIISRLIISAVLITNYVFSSKEGNGREGKKQIKEKIEKPTTELTDI